MRWVKRCQVVMTVCCIRGGNVFHTFRCLFGVGQLESAPYHVATVLRKLVSPLHLRHTGICQTGKRRGGHRFCRAYSLSISSQLRHLRSLFPRLS